MDVAVWRLRTPYLAAFLLIGLAAVETADPAHAGSTATRYDARGCVHIHCSATGDRCYRYADGLPSFRDIYLRRKDVVGNLHMVCDGDGDRCYPAHGRIWDFRAYYRWLGYRWNDEAH